MKEKERRRGKLYSCIFIHIYLTLMNEHDVYTKCILYMYVQCACEY